MKKLVFFFLVNIFFLPFSFGQLSVLLVNDNDRSGDEDLIDSISQSLDRLNYNYTIYDAVTEGAAPTSSTMMDYDMCIWYCGRDGTNLDYWSSDGQRNIQIFLDHGGMVWTMGRDLFYDEYGTSTTPPVKTFASGDFEYDYIGLSEYYGQSHRNDAGAGCEQLDVVSGQSICSLDPIEWDDPSYNKKYIGAFTPLATAESIYQMGPSGYALDSYYSSVYNENNTGKFLISGYAVSQLDTRAHRDTLIDQTLVYFYHQKSEQFHVLLYNDNNYHSSHIDKVKDAITNAGYHYQYFNGYGFTSSPIKKFMKHFDLVIWVTGDDGGSLKFWNGTDTDNSEIKNYIDEGGNFWLLGLDFIYDRYGSAPDNFSSGQMLYDYFGISRIEAQSWVDDGNTGVEQLDVSSGNGIFSFTPIDWTSSYLHLVDALEVTSGSKKVYEMGPSSYTYDGFAAGVYHEKGNGKVLSFTFDPHYINLQSDADTIFAQGIRYFKNENQLIISEIAYSQDDPNARFVEIYNAGSSDIDLSKEDWYLSYQDASTGTYTDIQLSGGTISSEDVWIVTKTAADFSSVFAFAADQENSSLSVNGDDPIFLYMANDHSTGILKDKYGLINEDGTGEKWEYTDSHAVRKHINKSPNRVFTQDEWVIREVSSNEMTPGKHRADISFSGSKSTTWMTKGNWDLNLLPDASFNTSIPSGKTVGIDGDAACNELSITGTLTINEAKTLTCYGNISNSGTQGNFHLNSTALGSASLITYGTVSGVAEMDCYFATLNQWYLVASPMEHDSANVFINQYLDYWSEADSSWHDIIDSSTILNPMQGYSVKKESNNTATYDGIFNTGNQSFTLSYTNQNASFGDGWNLIGNPYPSSIDWSLVTIPSGMNGGVSLWKNVSGGNRKYVVWNNGVGNDSARYIPPGQAMMVQATVNGTILNFSNSIRTHTNASGFEKKANEENVSIPNVLQITAKANGTFDDTYIRFIEDAGDTFNGKYEIMKLFSSDATIPQVFTLDEENKLAINAITQPEEESIIPLSIKMNINSKVNLEFSGLETFPDEQILLLYDKQYDSLYNIKSNNIVSFNHNTNDLQNRFNLIFSINTNIEENPVAQLNTKPLIYSHQNKLYIINKDYSLNNANISIFNVLGQRVWNGQMNKDFHNGLSFSFPQDYYLIQVQTKENTFTEKVYFY